jgi:fructose-bisphosphate aldolase class 1
VTAQDLTGTARALVADDKGLLAMDASTPACNRRFAALGIPQIEEARRAYRELIVATTGLGDASAASSSTTRRSATQDGTPFVKVITDVGITPGIKAEAVDEVSDATVSCLLRSVPAAVPGPIRRTGLARSNAMHVRFKSRLP